MLSLAILLPCNVSAQQPIGGKKKLAVYVTGKNIDDEIKYVIGSKMVEKITLSPKYSAVERSADFMREIQKELGMQTSGMVSDRTIAKIGQMLGVKYVAVANLQEVFNELYADARLIDVETGEIMVSTNSSSAVGSLPELVALAEKIANALTGRANAVTGRANAVGGRANAVGGQSIGSAAAPGSGGDIETFTVNGVTFEMVRVEGGSFMMGSSDPEAESTEKPVHAENVATFYIGRTEVTQDLWLAVMGSNPSYFRGGNLPVEQVSWTECQAFCERLRQLTGRQFRLPTEVEWEYAARGGNRSRGYKYSGGNDLYYLGWYTDNSGGTTHPVGTKQANELGIYDMSGNVWEWTSDLWSSNYSSYRNGGSGGSYRVNRGGSWNYYARYCRTADRSYNSPGNRGSYLGLRLVF